MSPAKGIFLGVAALIGIVAVVPVISIVTQPVRSAAGVASRTFDSGNMIRTYELFHDRHQGYQARLRQIADTERMLAAETDNGERVRLRVELAAQRMSCREIASAYNADAAKTNREIFRGREAPVELEMGRCG